jgi:hypothetical protein
LVTLEESIDEVVQILVLIFEPIQPKLLLFAGLDEMRTSVAHQLNQPAVRLLSR